MQRLIYMSGVLDGPHCGTELSHDIADDVVTLLRRFVLPGLFSLIFGCGSEVRCLCCNATGDVVTGKDWGTEFPHVRPILSPPLPVFVGLRVLC